MRTAIGIRCAPERFSFVVLSVDTDWVFKRSVSRDLPAHPGTTSRRVKTLRQHLLELVESARPTCAGIATYTAGTRLRSTGIDRIHLEGAAMFILVESGIDQIDCFSTREMKRHVPALSRSCRVAMDVICSRLKLDSGRGKDITKDPYSLDAFVAAAIALSKSGVALPDWLSNPL